MNASRIFSVLRARPELVLSPLALAVVVATWALITSLGFVSPIVLPPPADVARGLWTLLSSDYFLGDLTATALEMVLGFIIASISAYFVAVILVHVPLLRRVVYPFMVVLQVMPMIVLAPVMVIWFGFGIESKIVIAVTTAFFVVLVTSLAGFDQVHSNSVLLMRSLVAPKRQTFFMLTLPSSLPYVVAGLKTASTMALIGALVGEFVTAEAGLGRLLTQFSFALRQDLVFATVLVVAALGIALYGTVALFERWLVWWR